MNTDHWQYPHAPIATIESLAKALGVPVDRLCEIAKQVPALHCPGKRQPKKDGTFRDTHNAKDLLKRVHREIKSRLLTRVVYPPYLTGSLPNSPGVQRGIRGHTAPHLACSVLISEDIENFFPSITDNMVNGIWKGIFSFTPEVADLLTTLTTYKGSLPQGWIPSSFLANMALWKNEPHLVDWCHRQGFQYTRYVDDISLSSPRPLSKTETTAVINNIHAMVIKSGFRVKRSKHMLARNGQRKTITGQHINRRQATLPKAARKKIRAAVHRCECMKNNNEKELIAAINSTRGRIEYLSTLHPAEAAQLRERLNQVIVNNRHRVPA